MLKVETKALVSYTCVLSDEEELKVRNYAKENNVSLDRSIKDLWEDGEIDIYNGEEVESDCETQEVGYSEFNNCE